MNLAQIEYSPNQIGDLYLKSVVPISLLYSLSLWLSNSAYIYLFVSFIQMLKALMPITVITEPNPRNQEHGNKKKMVKIGKKFQGKVAIVTTSTQGIGFSIAERLGLEGAKLVISSRRQLFAVWRIMQSSLAWHAQSEEPQFLGNGVKHFLSRN